MTMEESGHWFVIPSMCQHSREEELSENNANTLTVSLVPKKTIEHV